MRAKLFILAVLTVAAAALFLGGCKKAQQPVRLDPHSAEAVMVKLVEQANLLDQAVARNDFKYVHDYTYYFHGLAQTFSSKLNDDEKQRVTGLFDELNSLTDQLDHASGRKHLEATQVSMNRLQVVLKELEKQFREMKQSDPQLSQR